MNVFSYVLAKDSVNEEPELTPDKFVIEDNIGEAIHIHYRNLRIEMSVSDFDTFATNVENAIQSIDNGNC